MLTTAEILKTAVSAKPILAASDTDTKNNVLKAAADYLIKDTDSILRANAEDTEAAKAFLNEVMIDRLTLTSERIEGMAKGILDVVSLPDPVGNILEETVRPNGLKIKKISVPMGVVAIIFESRPNVTSDAAALSLKSGNVCVLRGGKEAFNSNKAISESFKKALKDLGLPESCVNLIEDTSRDSANELMTARGYVDLLIPRGGAGLIRACVENAKVPCIETGTGICHIYVDESADFEKALNIIENAKTSRPSVCNAAEVCLVNRNIAKEFLPLLTERLTGKQTEKGKHSVELKLDKESLQYAEGSSAGEQDFDTEFLDYIMAVKLVENVEEAVKHISLHSTGHSEAIITENKVNADYFTAMVDSAAVYVNASTRFTDGGEFGLGCELGISTQKMHARGPMGLREMTTYKYVVHGSGQIR